MKGVNARALARYATAHPYDAVPLVRAGWRLRAHGWWRRFPFLPLPSDAYWNFRYTTAMGVGNSTMDSRSVVAAARWASRQRVGT